MSAVEEFLVPDLGEGLEDATVTGWNVAVGDDVELNQTLCTVETNKAEVEIPSPYSGRVVELGGAEGETLPVGSVLVRIATSAAEPESRTPPPGTNGSNGAVRRPVLVGYGADDEMDASRRGSVAERPRAKPPVRKLAAELNVDLARVTGTGADRVITREDVLAAAGRSAPTPDMVAVRGVQAEMAQRMALSRSQIPDAHAGVAVDCSSLIRLRDTADASGSAVDEAPISPFVLTLRLLTMALQHHPYLNSTWVDTTGGPQIHLHSAVHLGFGVAAPRGLLVPVVSDAQDKTTRELAAVVGRLIRGARAGTLRPSELHGSTFTVSNFGALGLDDGVPVINYPEAAILGMGSIKPRPLVVDGEVVVRPTMSLTCAFDHRIVDGAAVAAFMCELRDLVEAPELALLDL